MEKKEMVVYETPLVEIIEVEVEKGFASSVENENTPEWPETEI